MGIKRTATHNQRKNLFTLSLSLSLCYILYVPYFCHDLFDIITQCHNSQERKRKIKWLGKYCAPVPSNQITTGTSSKNNNNNNNNHSMHRIRRKRRCYSVFSFDIDFYCIRFIKQLPRLIGFPYSSWPITFRLNVVQRNQTHTYTYIHTHS